jgi:enoyl-CoA hydratase/carnithine racemase
MKGAANLSFKGSQISFASTPGVDVTETFARISVPSQLDERGLDRLALSLEAAVEKAAAVLAAEHAEGAFSTGLVLGKESNHEVVADAFERCIRLLRGGRLRTVALISGDAIGGGLGLAAACDVVLATPKARFGLPESLFGLVPGTILPLLLERVRPQKLRLLALTGETIDAEQAEGLGLVDERVNDDQLERTAKAWVRRLSRSRTEAVGAWKELTARVPFDLWQAMSEGRAVTRSCVNDPEVNRRLVRYQQEGIAPWVEMEC